MSRSLKEWAKELRERRLSGESFRPPGAQQDEGIPMPREVEISAPAAGQQPQVWIDGAEFKSVMDCSVEFGLDKPTVVTLTFLANVRTRKPQPPPSKDD